MSSKMSARARLNALKRYRSPDDPAVIDATRDLAAESLADFISRKIAETPPLTDEQVERLRALLPARHASPRTRPPGQSPRYSDTGEADKP